LKYLALLFGQYKTPLFYTGGSIAKAIAQMIAGFVIAKFVTPEDFGIWTTLNLAITYSMFLQAGSINGLNRELPYALGKGDERNALIMAGTVQTFTIFSSLLIILVGLSYYLIFPVDDPKFRYGLIGIILIISLSFYQNYLFSTFRSKQSFLKLSKIQFIHAFINIFTLILVIYYSYYGMVIKALLLNLIYAIFLHVSRPIKVGLIWNKEAFIKILKVGIPIFGLAYIESIAGTTDKVLLLKFSNIEDVGLYSFGFFALSSISIFSSSLASYIYPKMTYEFGKNEDKIIIWNYVTKITILILTLLTPVAIIGYFIIPSLIRDFFPAYIQSIPSMRILLFAGIFSGSIIGVNALWSLKIWKYMIIYQLSFSILLIVLPFLGLQMSSNKLEGVSFGVLAAHIVNLFIGLSLTYIATHRK
jgi:O-antigen/teichoic acid export membrane protein